MDEYCIIKGVTIILNPDLPSYQMKEKGYVNGIGKEIVTEVEVGELLYYKLCNLR